jgi:hypothetical protein
MRRYFIVFLTFLSSCAEDNKQHKESSETITVSKPSPPTIEAPETMGCGSDKKLKPLMTFILMLVRKVRFQKGK